MAGKSEKSASIFDKLKTGSILIGETGAEGVEPTKPVVTPKPETGTGDAEGNGSGNGNGNGDGSAELDFGALEPAEFFGDDPEGTRDDYVTSTNDANASAGNGGGQKQYEPRGRASPNYGKKASQKANLGFIEKTLFSVHLVASSLINDPSWALTEDEAKEFAKALGEVQEQYNLTMDPKTEAWLKLLTVAGSIYGPRIVIPMMAKRVMKQAQKEAPKENREPIRSPGTVTPIRQPNETGKGPLGAFTPSQMMPPGFGSGAEE